jgi:hypothetical protein
MARSSPAAASCAAAERATVHPLGHGAQREESAGVDRTVHE